MNGATVIDVEAHFINPEQDTIDSEKKTTVTSTLKEIFNTTVTIASVVFFFWLVGILFGFLVPFVGTFFSLLLTFFLGFPICAGVVQIANSIVLGVSGFIFDKILMPLENWVIKLFSK